MYTNFKAGESVSDENTTMKSRIRFKNEFSSLIFKRLIRGRQRKVYFGAFTTVLVVVVSMLIFYACNKDKGLLKINKSTLNMRVFDSMEALYEEINL